VGENISGDISNFIANSFLYIGFLISYQSSVVC